MFDLEVVSTAKKALTFSDFISYPTNYPFSVSLSLFSVNAFK